MRDTRGGEYTDRLLQRTSKRWKAWLNVQAPYRWNLRRRHLGKTLDVGCGIGRNLVALGAGSIGVDHNPTSVAVARDAGLAALTVDEWKSCSSEHLERFDSILIAHVIEHLSREDARQLIRDYLPALRRGGRVLMICPQERGYASDETHVTWTTGDDLVELAKDCGLLPEPWKSFPFPRLTGRWFLYNEFTVMATKPATIAYTPVSHERSADRADRPLLRRKGTPRGDRQ